MDGVWVLFLFFLSSFFPFPFLLFTFLSFYAVDLSMQGGRKGGVM